MYSTTFGVCKLFGRTLKSAEISMGFHRIKNICKYLRIYEVKNDQHKVLQKVLVSFSKTLKQSPISVEATT
jgi:hypothetical protein